VYGLVVYGLRYTSGRIGYVPETDTFHKHASVSNVDNCLT
jgi:hypothetical protein